MKVPIKDIENWYKDDVTGAVSCSDKAKYEQYMAAYRADLKEKEDFKALQKKEWAAIRAIVRKQEYTGANPNY